MARSLAELCLLGTEELGRLALKGKLRPSHLWTAMSGATKYREAVARGDVASEDVQEIRIGMGCMGCQICTAEASAVPGVVKHYCGRALEDRGRDGCGCLVAVTVKGKMMAAGKTVVGSERCPRGEW